MEWGIATHSMCVRMNAKCLICSITLRKPKYFVSFTQCDLINSIYRRGDIVSIDKRLYFNVLKDISNNDGTPLILYS